MGTAAGIVLVVGAGTFSITVNGLVTAAAIGFFALAGTVVGAAVASDGNSNSR